jgi:uncharacterized protein (TIGR02996 family)
MSEYEALLAAICAVPDEDTPRLALADWVEENGDADRAAFIRAQVELARTPAWEPFAVYCKWRKPHWMSGKPFRDSLPPVDGFHIEWPADAFRRGLGWRLNVRSLVVWDEAEVRLDGRVPVGEMYLWSAATLDDWRRFATSPLVRSLRKVHFVASPNEALRILRETPAALGITDLFFERASGAGMPFVIDDLLRSPLGKVVRGLHFHMGYESLNELVESLRKTRPLERASFAAMGLTEPIIQALFDGPALREVRELDLRDNPLDAEGLWFALERLPPGVRSLTLAGTGSASWGFAGFTVHGTLASLRRLDLSRNPLTPRMARTLARSIPLSGLQSLNLRKSRIGESGVRWLTRARFWPNLVELDLRENPISAAGVRHLLDAPMPPDLTALVLTGDTLGTDSRNELSAKYEERVVFVASELVGL